MIEGKKDRRDPIRTIKPKNPVAKNANAAIGGGAAGAHKDKKKAMKQGDVKHKNQDYAEGLQTKLDVALLEEFDSPEYNDEAGMAENNLLTLARAVKGLYDTIEEDDNLPEWCQEKIAKAEMMLVSVWDYLLSQKEQGINPRVSESVPKDPNAPKKVQDRKTGKWYDPNKEFDKTMNKPEVKAQMKRMAQKEGWTHDSLAAQLFETENTYEDKLSNLLKKRLGR
jgi:hypothetical protein